MHFNTFVPQFLGIAWSTNFTSFSMKNNLRGIFMFERAFCDPFKVLIIINLIFFQTRLAERYFPLSFRLNFWRMKHFPDHFLTLAKFLNIWRLIANELDGFGLFWRIFTKSINQIFNVLGLTTLILVFFLKLQSLIWTAFILELLEWNFFSFSMAIEDNIVIWFLNRL